MGVIQRQGIKQSIVFLLGAVIGGLNTIFIFTYAFQPNEIGLIRVFQDAAILVTSFIILGSSGLTIRFFPKFKDKDSGHHGFLSLILTMTGIGSLIFLLFVLGFKDQIIDFYRDRSPLISQYYYWLLPVAIGLSLSGQLQQYSSNFLRLTVPVIISQFIKPLMTILALAYVWHWITFSQVVHVFSLWYLVGVLILIFYIRYLGEWHINLNWRKFIDRKLFKEMSTYALFGLLVSSSNNLIFKADTIMLASMTDLKLAGIYSIPAFIASMLLIPTNSIISVSSPIISQAFHDHDFTEINTIYKKTSLNLSIIGLLFILLITASIGDLFDIMPHGDLYRVGIPVVYLLLFARLFDMITSVNNEIIGYSKHYKISFYLVMVSGILNIALNYLLIPKLQILGPAVATVLTLFLYNTYKLFFIYRKFGLQPFGKNTHKVFLIAGFVYLLTLIPLDTGLPLINILVKSAIITFVFVLLTIRWKISPEFTSIFVNLWERFKPH